MKLIIQIPCYNEEKYLPITVSELPKKIDGIVRIEILVIDDGSTDATREIAQGLGVDHIISLNHNWGLANAFSEGIKKCLEEGADIIVNTDGDNQYYGGDIEKLIKPILENDADVVMGDRQVDQITHFSWTKKKLLKIGGWFVRKLVDIDVQDVVGGFRAYSRDAAMRMNILSNYSYTLENLIQLKQQKLKIASVPIKTNRKLRKSRLIKRSFGYITSQLSTLLRFYTIYKPLKMFSILGIIVFIPGLFGLFRFLYYFFWYGTGKGHIQSLIFSVIFINVGFLIMVVGILADLIANNRKLIESILYTQKKSN